MADSPDSLSLSLEIAWLTVVITFIKSGDRLADSCDSFIKCGDRLADSCDHIH
jgi:hypothetical protein